MAQPVVDKKGDNFYPLDNAAIIFSHTTSKTAPIMFRIEAKITENVHLQSLQRALETIMPRYALYNVDLRLGFFWYYLNPLQRTPEVIADSRTPMEFLNIYKKNRFLFRVRAFRNTIACEFHHVLTDGSGALTFLKSLLLEYFKERGILVKDPLDIITVDTETCKEEIEDAYARYFKKGIPLPEKEKKVFHLPGKKLPNNLSRIIHGVVPVAEVLAEAKKLNLTVNEYLATIYFMALQEVYEKLPKKKKRCAKKFLSLQIPVSLRKMYPSKTLRNFFLTIAPFLDLRLGHYTFEEVAMRVYVCAKTEATDKAMYRQLSRNVGGEVNFFTRIFPLFIKAIVLNIVSALLGDSNYSGSISNLGLVKLPSELEELVCSFNFIPVKSAQFKASLGVISYKKDLHITFNSILQNTAIESAFFKQLISRGIKVTLESNI